MAVATDNGGRTNSSDPVSIFVNGAGSINITSPSSGSVLDPSANVVVTANATNSSGPISKVEFFANSTPIGQGSATGAHQYSVTWNSVSVGTYTLSAVLTDSVGVVTNSLPVKVAITSKPNVAIVSPVNGTSYSLLSRVSLMATAQDSDGFVSKLDFYANGSLIGSGSFIGQDRFTVDWTQVPTGVYSVTAVATDNLGVTNTSAAITIGINTPSPSAGEFIWFDDDVPAGATKHADGDVDWYWVDANPAAFSGSKAHQSRNFAQLDAPNNSLHRHYFDGATTIMPVAAGDKLFTYIFLDINNMPREIMLEWKDANSWEHRAYWGANKINSGTDGTNSRRYMGALPKAGTWVRLEVPASAVGLEGSTLNGMAFTLDAGRATWDLAGKVTSNATPPPTSPPGDSVWIEDGLPAGSVLSTINDQWNWVTGPRFSGQVAHQSQVSVNHNTTVYRSHSFTGAQMPLQMNPGDVLFTYIYVDPSAIPQQIMLQWYDGTGWEHRAFWGENFINHLVGGVHGTESQRYMGGVPPAGSWYRLEVPASYVGLEGKAVTGMAFSLYGKEPTVTWDRSGKAAQSTNVFLPLSATAAVWSLKSKNDYAYDTNTQGVPDHAAEGIAFYAHANQAAGTVPYYRFHDFKGKFYYSTCRDCAEQSGWIRDGVAFYVYPDASTPGTVPLYEFHGSETFFYSVTQNAPAGMSSNGISAYVYASQGLVPVPPSFLRWDGGCSLTWVDNSQNESGFVIEKDGGTWPLSLVPVATVGPNVTSLNICPSGWDFYVLRAYNSFGYSAYSNGTCTRCAFNGPVAPPNSPPSVYVTTPVNGEIVTHSFAITANAFDLDGAGTIAKVELFANGNKLGEVTDPPYVFTWNNAPSGTYSLTAKATDNTGAATTSNPVSVTVANVAPSVTITSPTAGSVLTAPANISISASASDTDGSVSKVEFFQGSTKLGEAATAPYNLAWNGVMNGSYVLTAVATDNSGQSTTSSPVSIVINDPPTISITTSEPESIPTPPATVTIYTDAYDSDGSITKIELFQGATLLGTASTSPFNFQWTNIGSGTYTVTAKATDNRGAVTTSNAVTLIVNAPPTVNMTSPNSGSSYFAPAFISMRAQASDSDGSVTRVDFYQGSTMIGGCATSPCTFNWTNVPVGSYVLTAKASDNRWARSTSTSVPITVTSNTLAIRKITFASNRDGKSQIYLMNTDGTGQSRLSNNVANDEAPKWSPDNSRLVFQSDRDYQGGTDDSVSAPAEIYTMKWDGTQQTRLTNNLYDDSAPTWSPDGTKIAFQSARNGVNYQIYVMNADGSGQVNISNSSANDMQPAWSPDGTKIAFASDRDHAAFSNIYVMSANGTNQTRVTASGIGTRDDQPTWSPDGAKLAFTSSRDSLVMTWTETDENGGVVTKTRLQINKEIYVINSDGSNPIRLTNTLENDDSPVWSNDGVSIVFRSDRERDCFDPTEQIWVMNADGSNQLDLSNDSFGDYCPNWSH